MTQLGQHLRSSIHVLGILMFIAFQAHGRPRQLVTSSSNYANSSWAPSNMTKIETITSARPKVIDGFCPKECFCFIGAVAHCSRVNLTRIPCEMETNDVNVTSYFPKSIRDLHLSNNFINKMPKNCFRRSGNFYQAMYLQNNNISVVEPRAFNGLTGLKTLDMKNNNLASITYFLANTTKESSFIGLEKNLQSIQLSYNRIRNIPNEAFIRFFNLKVLELSWNRIEWIESDAFQHLENLNTLRLRNNPLNLIALDSMDRILSWFSRPLALGDVQVNDRCQSANIDAHVREYNNTGVRADRWSSAERRKVKGEDSLKTLDLGELGLRNSPKSIPTSVGMLLLDGNRIRRLTANAFLVNKNLQFLHLANNGLEEIDDGVFQNLKYLTVLDLSKNKLKNLTARVMCGMTFLTRLRLHQNRRLSGLSEKVFGHSPRLQMLYLQDCALKTLPRGPWMYKLYALSLYGNPLNCTCQTLAPLITRLHYRNEGDTYSTKLLTLDPYRMNQLDDEDTWSDQRPEDAVCHSPPQHQGRRLMDFRIEDLKCSASDWLQVTIDRRLVKWTGSYQEDDIDLDSDMLDHINDLEMENIADQRLQLNYSSIDPPQKLSEKNNLTENYESETGPSGMYEDEKEEFILGQSNWMSAGDSLQLNELKGDANESSEQYNFNSVDFLNEDTENESQIASSADYNPAEESGDIALRSPSIDISNHRLNVTGHEYIEPAEDSEKIVKNTTGTRWLIELPSSALQSVSHDSTSLSYSSDTNVPEPEEYPTYQSNYDEVMYSGDVPTPSFEEEVTSWLENDDADIYRALLSTVVMEDVYYNYYEEERIEEALYSDSVHSTSEDAYTDY